MHDNSSNPVIGAAEQYVAESACYRTMRELGTILNVTSHVVGRKLKEAGLRTPEGKPSARAVEDGYTKLVLCETYMLDLWHEEKTLRVLRPLITAKGGNEIMPGVFIG